MSNFSYFLSSLEKILLEIPLQKIKFGSTTFACFCPLICLFSWGFNAKRNEKNNVKGFFYIGIVLVPLPSKWNTWDLKRTTKNRTKNQVLFSASSFQKLVEREWMTVVLKDTNTSHPCTVVKFHSSIFFNWNSSYFLRYPIILQQPAEIFWGELNRFWMNLLLIRPNDYFYLFFILFLYFFILFLLYFFSFFILSPMQIPIKINLSKKSIKRNNSETSSFINVSRNKFMPQN